MSFFPASLCLSLLHSHWQNLMASSEGPKKRFKSVERKRKLLFISPSSPTSTLFFPPLWKVMEPLLSSPSTTCHCGPHFPKDYCHWPLPFGQSWHHSHCPWLQWLAGQRGGNRYSLSTPYSHIWEKDSSVDLLTSHHSSHFFSLSFISVCSLSHAGQLHNRSILLPVPLPVKCLDRSLSALMMHRSVNDFKEKQCHLWDLWMCLITDLKY